jgi:hypothetical protein
MTIIRLFISDNTFVLNGTDNSRNADTYPKWNSLDSAFRYPISMKRSELTNKQKLLVPCPICAAAVGERCKMYSGLGRRNEPHAERKYYAIQAIEQDYGPPENRNAPLSDQRRRGENFYRVRA